MTQELVRNATQTIGTDSAEISPEQYGTQRTVIFISNNSTGGQTISISLRDEAKAGEGIVLSPGGYYQDTIDAGYKPSNLRVCAISSAAGGIISIHERILMGGM